MEFRKITGGSTKKEKIRISQKPYGANGKVIRISSLKFSGDCSESVNGEFWVAWSDTYVLKKNSWYFGQGDQILLSGEGQMLQYGKVVNNGNFIINDSPRDNLGNTFYAIDKNGNTLIQYKFEETVSKNAISQDGNFAVCDCGGFLYFFDINSSSLIWKIKPRCGSGYACIIDVEKKQLHIKYLDERVYRYDFEGNFIDKEKWEEERITYGTIDELYLIAKELLSAIAKKHSTAAGSPISQDIADRVLSVLNHALTAKEIDQYPKYKSIFYRMLGEVYEFQYDTDRAIENFEWALQFEQNPLETAKIYRLLGEVYESRYDIDQAIKNFESALQLNPKVGVKKRLNNLEKIQSEEKSRSIY